MSQPPPTDERLRRWRLLLGGDAADGTGVDLHGRDAEIDRVLAALYEPAAHGGASPDDLGTGAGGRRGGTAALAPQLTRWLGDIRTYFPASVVAVMQKDAIERLRLSQLLLEPELLSAMQPDVHLVATLLALKGALPDRTRATARQVVQRVVDDLMKKLANRTRQAVQGSLNKAARTFRPRAHEIDWPRTIRRNLKHYQPQYRTIVPATLVGFGRRRPALREMIMCVDQSGSMATSVVYAGIFAAVLASLPSLRTHLVLFDTRVVDVSAQVSDPIELLFAAQLGGGTDINRALAYCQTLVQSPRQTILVLLSDLFEGGNREEAVARVRTLTAAGVRMIALLALNDEGAPAYDHALAGELAALGVPTFACTPDRFADVMAAAIAGGQIDARQS